MRPTDRGLRGLLLGALLLTAFPLGMPAVALAEDAVDSRAAELAKLRREVEALSADVQLRKEDLRSRLKAIEAQNLEIGVQIRREELRLAQVAGEAEARRAELSVHAASSSGLVPPLLSSIAAIRASVEGGLPFRIGERLAELDTLRDQLGNGLLTPEAATARLWAFTEDELRLTRENGLERQTVPLESGEVLADVARLGMVALYFRTDGGVVGAAVRNGDAWTWRAFSSRDDEVAVEGLFEKMKHGVRTGSFMLPNPEAAP
ncbi:MAG: DUF3450 family protein [Deltaproteobacteria bacterium]|nr:DUF3450 family protein [Deltaproteobacteria bacterium]